MKLRTVIRTKCIERLPRRYRFFIERYYNMYCHSRSNFKDNMSMLRRLCKPDKVAVDVGASYGSVTLYLCKYARHVYCYEPIPTAADYLRQKYASCNVTVANYALGNVDGEMLLSIPHVREKRLDGWSSFIKSFDKEIISGEIVTFVEKLGVKIRRLDSFGLIDVGLIKIDVEGYELEVLKGGENTIRRDMPNLFIEIEKRHHKHNNVYTVFDWLRKLGYSAYYLKGDRLESIEYFDFESMQNVKNEQTIRYVNDFVFLPIGSHILNK